MDKEMMGMCEARNRAVRCFGENVRWQNAFDDPEHGDDGERVHNLKAWAKGKEIYLNLRTIKLDDSKNG